MQMDFIANISMFTNGFSVHFFAVVVVSFVYSAFRN